jgi:asparagine synthase (glutamine-hydrolysing)
MNSLQKHRGPDGDGIFEDSDAGVALGHVRLSILDLTPAAVQPMHTAEGRFVVVFNGEIYNFRELRGELAARGCTFQSTGDTEVLLQGLAELGPHFLTRLNGIFAFALWDRRERELLLARDQIGVKPLYYAELPGGKLIFASEFKALCAHPELVREPNFLALQQHLAYCYASGNHTALKGVMRVPAAHMLRWQANGSRLLLEPYWKLPFNRPQPISRKRAVGLLQQGLQAAVAGQLVSDVPVGGMLSGGLDSSLILALAAEAGQELTCFTTAWTEEQNTLDQASADLPYAKSMASHLGLNLTEITLTSDLTSLLPQLIRHLDEPLADPSILACYAIAKEARRSGIPVLLSGQGGDELFCGYPRYLVMHLTRWLNRLPPQARHWIAQAARNLPSAHAGATGVLLRRIRKALGNIDMDWEHRFLDMCANTPGGEVANLLSPDFRNALAGHAYSDDCIKIMIDAGLSGLQKLQARDLAVYLPNHNLLYMDKISMAAGVEVRVPLLDMGIVSQVLRYPYDWQLAGWRTKALFRDAAKPYVPRNICVRRKAGFGAPFRHWLRHELKALWDDLCSEQTIKSRGWFDYAAIQSARKRSQEGSTDLYMLQWAVMTQEIWAREFLDHNPASERP